MSNDSASPQPVPSVRSPLSRVVEVNENAKAVLRHSHQVNLCALDAIVRSVQAGHGLRGFSEVSSQMRNWSRELDAAVRELSELSARQIRGMSAFTRAQRNAALLQEATREARDRPELRAVAQAAQLAAEQRRSELRGLRKTVSLALQDLERLGLMASVLSQSALIEAASGNAEQRRNLSAVSKGFASQAEEVNKSIRAMLACNRENEL